MVSGRRKTKKLPLNVESPSPPLRILFTYFFSLLVPNALLKRGGHLGSTNHSGRTAMDTSFRRGWLASNVCSVAMLLFIKWCILKQSCFVRLLVA